MVLLNVGLDGTSKGPRMVLGDNGCGWACGVRSLDSGLFWTSNRPRPRPFFVSKVISSVYGSLSCHYVVSYHLGTPPTTEATRGVSLMEMHCMLTPGI